MSDQDFERKETARLDAMFDAQFSNEPTQEIDYADEPQVNDWPLYSALPQPKPEPVAWMYEFGTDNGDAVNKIRWYPNVHWKKPTGLVRNVVPLYTAPPKREWQGLTDEEREEATGWSVEHIESALKTKNA